VELLRPLGFFAIYPENHAAMCSVKKMVPDLSDSVEKEGLDRSLCGYARADIGSVVSGKTPVGRLPKPDLLCCCTNICQTVLGWYRALASKLDVPLVVIDTPFVYGQARPHDLDYVKDQLDELVAVGEEITKKKMSRSAFIETLRLARHGTDLWGECLATSMTRPAPWTGFDQFFHIAPIVTLRGTELCNKFYRHLRDELQYRAEKGVGGVADERYRLLWDNLPVWFAVRELADVFAERGFNFVCTTYTDAWAEAGKKIDPRDPELSPARSYTHVILNQDLTNRLELMSRLAATYRVNGAVLHSDRSCKPYSIGQIDLRDKLARRAGIRVLILDADHADQRAYAAAPVENRLQAFMEQFA
jgi:benzoyl-CoA reductase/2-hydroxyglutaryl-CoA dehydratase subunit BcrC/BadD/HgdB